jgi:hypothetical protein
MRAVSGHVTTTTTTTTTAAAAIIIIIIIIIIISSISIIIIVVVVVVIVVIIVLSITLHWESYSLACDPRPLGHWERPWRSHPSPLEPRQTHLPHHHPAPTPGRTQLSHTLCAQTCCSHRPSKYFMIRTDDELNRIVWGMSVNVADAGAHTTTTRVLQLPPRRCMARPFAPAAGCAPKAADDGAPNPVAPPCSSAPRFRLI